jgi:hypothetical protein
MDQIDNKLLKYRNLIDNKWLYMEKPIWWFNTQPWWCTSKKDDEGGSHSSGHSFPIWGHEAGWQNVDNFIFLFYVFQPCYSTVVNNTLFGLGPTITQIKRNTTIITWNNCSLLYFLDTCTVVVLKPNKTRVDTWHNVGMRFAACSFFVSGLNYLGVIFYIGSFI